MTPSEQASAPFSWVQFAVLRFVTIALIADWLAAIPMPPRSIKTCIGPIRILFIDEQYSAPRPCATYECDLRNLKVSFPWIDATNPKVFISMAGRRPSGASVDRDQFRLHRANASL